MKIAVINFSGNVGKTTIARHLLCPRIPDAQLIGVETVNADGGRTQSLRGRQFGELQAYLQTVDNAVVDIGASNVEDLLALMDRYRGSQQDFDCFVVPTVSPLKQQQDTAATLVELARLGVPPRRLRLLFNMVEHDVKVEQAFATLLAFLGTRPLATANLACRLSANELYGRLKSTDIDLAALAADTSDYKALIAKARDAGEKLALAQQLATRRLASGVVPELDACFAALQLEPVPA